MVAAMVVMVDGLFRALPRTYSCGNVFVPHNLHPIIGKPKKKAKLQPQNGSAEGALCSLLPAPITLKHK
jgi:hypothetical protein